jgi:hypothetical protein
MKTNKQLYESIMMSVAKQVKKALNEWGEFNEDGEEYRITKEELPELSDSQISKFKIAFEKLMDIARNCDAPNFERCRDMVANDVESVLSEVFGRCPAPIVVLAYLADRRGQEIDWSSLEDLGYTDPENV